MKKCLKKRIFAVLLLVLLLVSTFLPTFAAGESEHWLFQNVTLYDSDNKSLGLGALVEGGTYTFFAEGEQLDTFIFNETFFAEGVVFLSKPGPDVLYDIYTEAWYCAEYGEAAFDVCIRIDDLPESNYFWLFKNKSLPGIASARTDLPSLVEGFTYTFFADGEQFDTFTFSESLCYNGVFTLAKRGDDVLFNCYTGEWYSESNTSVDNVFIRIDGVPDVSASFNEGYNSGFDAGYASVDKESIRQEGYDSGFTDGYASVDQESIRQEGYDSGFTDGYDSVDPPALRKEGYDLGYVTGKKDAAVIAETGNFSSLFTSVIDAPVRAVTSLLDFEILGQNMLSFFGALLSLCLILFILKKVI